MRITVSKNKEAVAVLPEPLLVRTSEAARLLGISEWSVRRLVKRKQIACRKLSKCDWLIPMASIRAYATVKP
jgi:Helix-turn-helix domain